MLCDLTKSSLKFWVVLALRWKKKNKTHSGIRAYLYWDAFFVWDIVCLIYDSGLKGRLAYLQESSISSF